MRISSVALALCVSLAGCGGDAPAAMDAGLDAMGVTDVWVDAQAIDAEAIDADLEDGDAALDAEVVDAAADDASMIDGATDDASVVDAASPDDAGALDAGSPDSATADAAVACPGAARPSLASGEVCEVTAGGRALLITADVLTPDGVLPGGQVLVDDMGVIACVACDCSSAAGASGATRIDCPDGVLSPGLVNAHDHITYAHNDPYTSTGERYEQRHDWRIPRRGHTRITVTAGATANQIRWGELRMVLSGATSINGAGGADGFARNLDQMARSGLGRAPLELDVFPVGDVTGVQLTSGCDYGGVATTAADVAGLAAYAPHVSMGIDAVARQELLCANGGAAGGNDIVASQTAIMHGIALLPGDIAAMAGEGAMLVWSPRSDIAVYGDTARVTEYDRLGARIALGTDWMPTGSMNMLRELECADSFNADYLDGHFSDEDLWRMATIHGAIATGTEDALGSIAVGLLGDLAIYDGSARSPHRAVIDAAATDVILVVREGEPLFGASSIVPLLMGTATCDALDVCGEPRVVCAQPEIAMSLAALQASVGTIYPLFSCDVPLNEPSCIPRRGASVAGSTIYTGVRSASDSDGDGLANALDLCPTVFDPIRPLDEGTRADADADGVGDACDACPLVTASTGCPPS